MIMKKKMTKLLYKIYILSQICWTFTQPWAFHHTKKFENPSQAAIFTKDCEPFSQLLVYWNGKLPKNGKWEIYAQVKYVQNQKWSEPILLMRWQKRQNCSFLHSCKDQKFKNYHVRSELENQQLADAFKITILPKNKADLKSLSLIGATTCNLKEFKKDSKAEHKKFKSTQGILKLPKISQIATEHKDAARICSPTSLTMALNFLGDLKLNPNNTANQVYDSCLDAYGSWQYNIAYASDILHDKYYVHLKRLKSFQEIIDSINKKLPVIVSVRGDIKGAPKSYQNGHLIAVIGYDAQRKKVICHDPAWSKNKEVFKAYPLSDFLNAWAKSHHLAYCFEKKINTRAKL
jgi:hypothetical protein